MESVLVFVNDKKRFLYEFTDGKFESCPLVIGMVFSFCQKDLKDGLGLFVALERLVNETKDEMQIFYCVFKMMKSGQDYLKAKYDRPEFVRIYCKVVSLLNNLKIPRSLESKTLYFFTENWHSLADIFAYSEAFIEVYYLGKNFARLFSKLPMVLSTEIENEMSQLVEFKSACINKEFLLSLNGVMRYMKFYHNPKECLNLGYFLSFVVVFVYKNSENLEVLYEIKRKVEEYSEVFSEQSRIEMNLKFKAAVQKMSGETLDPMRAENISKPMFSNLLEAKNQDQSYNPPNNLIKIPEKGYENPAPSPPAGFKSDPKPVINELFNKSQRDPFDIHPEHIKHQPAAFRPDQNYGKPQNPYPGHKDAFFNRAELAPSEINVHDQSIENTIMDLFENLKEQYRTTKTIDLSQVQSILISFNNESVLFRVNLKNILKKQIESNIKGDDLELWDLIIDACRGVLENDDISDILKANEDRNKKISSEEFLARGHGGSRSRLSRPYRRGNGGEYRNFIGEGREKCIDQEEYKNERKYIDKHDLSSEWSYESPNQSIQDERLVYSAQASPNISKALGLEIQKDPVVYVEPQPKIETNDYIQLLNKWAHDIVNTIRSDATEIIKLNDVLISIKNEIKQKSPSCTFNLIGSAYLGTHIKNTPVDACFIDFLTPEPQTLLKSAIHKLGYEIKYDSDSYIVFKSNDNEYRVFINNELFNESTSLLREYCSFGSIFQGLIILLKYWTISYGLNINNLSGYHLSLICLCYLQCFDPPILPKLQQNIKENTGHWYIKNLEFDCKSPASIGDGFYYLFSTLIGISKYYICDPIQGIFIPSEPVSFLSCFNVVNKDEVSNLRSQDPKSQQFFELLQQTSLDIENQKDLYKIMRLK